MSDEDVQTQKENLRKLRKMSSEIASMKVVPLEVYRRARQIQQEIQERLERKRCSKPS